MSTDLTESLNKTSNKLSKSPFQVGLESAVDHNYLPQTCLAGGCSRCHGTAGAQARVAKLLANELYELIPTLPAFEQIFTKALATASPSTDTHALKRNHSGGWTTYRPVPVPTLESPWATWDKPKP